MEERPRRGFPWRLSALAAAALLSLVAAFYAWINAVANRKWERMRARVEGLEQEISFQDPSHLLLDGEPTEGDAWDDYKKAGEELGRAVRAPWRIGTMDPSEIDAIVKAHPGILEHLGRGARRSRLQAPHGSWGSDLLNFILQVSKLRFSENRDSEGFEKAILALQLAMDMDRVPHHSFVPSGLDDLDSALGILDGVIRTARPPPERLERVLERLDRHFPSGKPSLQRDLAEAGRACLQWATGVDGPDLRVWRNAWTARIGVTRAFEQYEEWHSRISTCDSLPWTVASVVYGEVRAEMAAWPDRQLEWRRDALMRNHERPRCVLAHCRILRVAVRYRGTEEVLELDDPFGSKICSYTSANRGRFWSVGPDGQNLTADDISIEVTR